MHWKHSRFEIAHLILGNCHTYDEAYRVLCELEEDRDFAIQSSLAESLRAQAKVLASKVILNDETESKSGKMLAQCNIDEQKARKVTAQPCLDEARRELEFIRLLKEKIEPYRLFRQYEDYDAHQLCQRLEWKFDLQWKTYNYLCSSGTLPPDHLILIKTHPDSDNLIVGLQRLQEYIEQYNAEHFLLLSKKDVLSLICDEEERTALLERKHIDEKILSKDLNLEALEFSVSPRS